MRGPRAPDDTSFEILLAWSDRTLIVGTSETALDVLVAAGIPVEPGCQTGGCGMCATEYVEGDIEHRDACLTAADRARYFCPCVSRARTRVVLAV
ncbi:MAG: 2Fe-2S iron-sulfur cluster binding domain-containing protein [Hyphomicrobiaceae bacterium]|nr:2Fe-2S iron-sulfur cluster binding domain-containing protein [Hyphomicrobiaceae bacterium]